MDETKMARIQDGHHYQVKLERMKEVWVRLQLVLSQSQSGVRVFLSESERKITKVSESNMAVSESNMAEFKMAKIINLSEIE